MPIGDYCQRDVESAELGVTIAEAARRMADRGLGCLVVMDGVRPCGILTDRDVAIRTLRRGLDPATATIDAITERDIVVLRESSMVRVAISLMRRHGVRRLPVLDDDARLVGIVTWDDLLGLLAAELGGVAATVLAQGRRRSVPTGRALEEVVSAS